MKVTAVGTSCSWFVRNNTSFIIDEDFIFDIPSGSYKEIIQKINLEKVKALFISHFHSDHFGDFHLIATRFMREFNGSEKLKVYAPKGALDRMIRINYETCAGCDELSHENYKRKIEFIDLYDGFEFNFNNYKLKAYKVDHGDVETYGFTIKDQNNFVVAFSADTRECDNLHKMLESSNVAFIDMSSVKQHKKHLSINDVEILIKKYPNCKIYPIHTCDKCQDYARKNMNFVEDGQVFNF